MKDFSYKAQQTFTERAVRPRCIPFVRRRRWLLLVAVLRKTHNSSLFWCSHRHVHSLPPQVRFVILRQWSDFNRHYAVWPWHALVSVRHAVWVSGDEMQTWRLKPWIESSNVRSSGEQSRLGKTAVEQKLLILCPRSTLYVCRPVSSQ